MTAATTLRSLRHRLRVEVSTLILGVLVLQALLLLSLGYWGAERLLHDVGREAHKAEHTRLETEIRSLLGTATGAVRALAASPGQGEGAGEKRSAELIWALMTDATALDGLYFAHHDGVFVGLERHPVAALRRIEPGPKGLRETQEFKPGLERLDVDPALRYATSRTQVGPSTYDVRAQPWFQQAVSSMQPHWTAVHALPFSGELGVIYAVADNTPDAHGQYDGVAAGHFALRHLERLVETFSHAGAGESAVLNQAHDEILARSDDEGFIQVVQPPAPGDILRVILAELAAHPADPRPVAFAGQRFLVRGSPIPGTPWKLVSWLPEDAVVGGLKRTLAAAGGLLLACLGGALLLSLGLSRRITGPIELLAGVARRIGRLELEDLPRVESHVEEIHRLDASLAESARSLHAFRKFVPADVVRQLMKQGQPLEPGGHEVELTVMFTDVEGFTGIAARVGPDRLVPQLTEYFSAAADVVVKHGGTIDKYIGDGMMVLWGAPEALPDAAYHAAQAAVELQARLDACNADWVARGLPRLPTRIGLHTGPAVAGVLGSHERLSFTAFGDTVNLASRIEGANKDLGSRILVSEATAQALQGRLPLEFRGELELRGRSGRWRLYELLRPAS